MHGKDIVIALWKTGSVGVMLNNGDGTFGALKPYSRGRSARASRWTSRSAM